MAAHPRNHAIMFPADDNELPEAEAVAVPVPQHPNNLNHDVNVQQGHVSSPFLLDLIRQDLPCVSVLSGNQVQGCSLVAGRCRSHPAEVYYQCPRTGRTPLHAAALKCSCIHVMRAIMEEAAARDVQMELLVDAAGNTPLHLFFIGGLSTKRIPERDALEILELMLGQTHPGAAASFANRTGSRPLHLACSAPESMIPPSLVQRLVEANPGAAASVASSSGQTPLHVHCARPNASTQVARLLISVLARFPSLDTENGWTPLHYAASNSNDELIRLLLQSYDDNIALIRTSREDWTALHMLMQQNPSERQILAVHALVEAGPEALAIGDSLTHATPLHLLLNSSTSNSSTARRRGGGSSISEVIVRILVQAMPGTSSIPDHNQYLSLHCACEKGADASVVALLLETFPEAAMALTKKNDTALSLACAANKSLETIELLLNANPNAMTRPNDYGFLPIHCICRAYQPRVAIVQALVQANPSTVKCPTNAGELAVHVACNNTSASVGVLQVLTAAGSSSAAEATTSNEEHDPSYASVAFSSLAKEASLANKIGNTPLHYACFRGAPLDHIESLAISNPCWITTRNNAGYSPIQIICKSGRIDQRAISLFSRIGGPDVFSVVDVMGNTPLHSAMREETDARALLALIQAYPDALYMKTMYDDTPLHLACLRRVDPQVVRQVALASSAGIASALAHGKYHGRLSPTLVQNTAGQTPIGIAMEELDRVCHFGDPANCCVTADYTREQNRSFETLAALVKILHYGPPITADQNAVPMDVDGVVNNNSQNSNELQPADEPPQSLVGACVALHRIDVRLDPAFIRRALHLRPEEARIPDEEGNFPLHIEASIPIEKMGLLDASSGLGCCGGTCHKRIGLLRMLLEIYPEATTRMNRSQEFPLSLMVQNGRVWDSTFALVLQSHPQALHSVRSLDPWLVPLLLSRLYSRIGIDAVFTYLRSHPNPMARD